MAGVDAFALLVEELKSEDITDQLTAAKKISTIALGMGVEKSKSQLIPYLLQIIETHTDEVQDLVLSFDLSPCQCARVRYSPRDKHEFSILNLILSYALAQILHAIAESIPSLIPAIGGGENAHLLLPSLEALAEKDETIVRSKVSYRSRDG